MIESQCHDQIDPNVKEIIQIMNCYRSKRVSLKKW
jgi:hypothetical protein